MQLTPPKQIVFYISLVAAILGVLNVLGIMFTGAPESTGAWLVIAAYALLAIGNTAEGF